MASEQRPTWRLWQRLTARPVLFSGVVLAAFLVLCGAGAALLVHAEVDAITPPPSAVTTPDPTVGWLDYVGATLTDLQLLDTHLGQMGLDCDGAHQAMCDADAHLLASDVTVAQTQRTRHPAPLCLRAVDQQYGAYLALLGATATETYTGIEANNAALQGHGAVDMDRAFAAMPQATAAVSEATCS